MAPGISLGHGAPVCCNAVENFVNDRHLNALRRKVSQSKTSIKNTWSHEEERKLQTSKRNVKKEQMQGDRFSAIERENMRLLLKMQEIEHRGPAKAAGQAMLGGGGPRPPQCARGGSLPPIGAGSKAGARVRELRRIDEDNQKLLRRLHGARSSVCLPQLEEQHRARQKVMRMRCEHQKPEWKEMYPAPKIVPRGIADQPGSPIASEGRIDAECERLLALQERLRAKADMEDSLLEPEAQRDGGASPSSACGVGRPDSDTSPLGAAALGAVDDFPEDMLGGVIPASSKALVESLLAQEAEGRAAAEAAAAAEAYAASAQDSEEQALAAKEAAADALRRAMALDTANDGLLEYGDVVSRFNR